MNLTPGERFIMKLKGSDMEKLFTVGRLAKKTGLSAKSIRYYEQEKLIPKAVRSQSGYRLYSPKIIERLQFIQKAKSIGFALDDIRRILELTDRKKPCCDKVFEWSERRLQELDEQIKFLGNLKEKLVHYRKQWKERTTSQTIPESEICKLIDKVELSEAKLR